MRPFREIHSYSVRANTGQDRKSFLRNAHSDRPGAQSEAATFWASVNRPPAWSRPAAQKARAQRAGRDSRRIETEYLRGNNRRRWQTGSDARDEMAWRILGARIRQKNDLEILREPGTKRPWSGSMKLPARLRRRANGEAYDSHDFTPDPSIPRKVSRTPDRWEARSGNSASHNLGTGKSPQWRTILWRVCTPGVPCMCKSHFV